MPSISKFLGIVIIMLWNEHNPPHFHARYGEYEVLVHIKTGIVEGVFPRRALKLILEWHNLHKEELLDNWNLCKNRENPNKIQPLE